MSVGDPAHAKGADRWLGSAQGLQGDCPGVSWQGLLLTAVTMTQGEGGRPCGERAGWLVGRYLLVAPLPLLPFRRCKERRAGGRGEGQQGVASSRQVAAGLSGGDAWA
jgi:hypothetical protein